jgi:inosose dehydratase
VLERSNTFLDDEGGGSLVRRLAGAPISWGVCEVPGWGPMLPPDVVLAEMAALGLAATELGPTGWLPEDPAVLRDVLDRHGLKLIAGFVPLVLHDPAHAAAAREEARRAARLLGGLGAHAFVSAAVASAEWAPRAGLEPRESKHLHEMLTVVDEIAGAAGLVHALHPHVGTLVETAADIDRIAGGSDVRWCLDTGHLVIGGADPLALTEEPERIAHVHLKDVDLALAAEVRSGATTLREATRRGLFRPLGRGGAPVGEVVAALERAGYAGWYVLEQDAVLPEHLPENDGPTRDVEASIDYLRRLAGGGIAEEAPKGKETPRSHADRDREEVA